MKKALFIPLLFACFVSIGQIDSASIIGKSIRIGNLVVAQNDFRNPLSWDDAQKACNALGYGWRLPTQDELTQIYLFRGGVGNFKSTLYMSSTVRKGKMWCLSFRNDGDANLFPKSDKVNFRAVRNFK